MTSTNGDLHAELVEVVREHASRVAVSLMRVTGDFATAEDLVQDAIVTALNRWPTEGIPERPGAWLFTVARNRGLDVLRRGSNYRTKLAQLQWPVQPEPDERLRLIFTCCHPALSRPSQIALTLRVVCGLTTAQTARAFLVPETTVAQRITRANRKIADAGIPYRIPDPDELNPRLAEVLTVVYLLLNEGYLSTDEAHAPDLVEHAEWLATLLDQLIPTEPEVAGLLALIRLQRAIALRYTAGPQAALEELDPLAEPLDGYHLYHATRAELLRALGHPDQARDADERALQLTTNPAEQALLQERINWT